MHLSDIGLALIAVVTGQQWSPPHYIMGYQLSEWASIAAIIMFVSGMVVGLVRIAVVNPANVANRELKRSIDSLTAKVDGIGITADQVHKEHDHRLDKHEIWLARHDEELENLKEKITNDKV
ncbi:hypothetical protein ACFP1L_11845 [Lactiplantibacillus nangangensis]|uniref:Uncharacterized protein n=1 Tax=Lactiplantibacillus nangangensis TaxID=2559917 RepID=A0ABW1SLL4_9LACO|nr:hypothetical protein [Lactiplantibacillus nangangensis]